MFVLLCDRAVIVMPYANLRRLRNFEAAIIASGKAANGTHREADSERLRKPGHFLTITPTHISTLPDTELGIFLSVGKQQGFSAAGGLTSSAVKHHRILWPLLAL